MMKRIFFTTILTFILAVSAFAQNEQSPCPKIDVSGGGVIQIGEPMFFTANVQNIPDSALGYEWTTSAGTIIEGSGSPAIKIDTTGLSQTDITATVKIKGLPENCADSFSESGAIKIICRLPRLLDEFGKLQDNDVKARIDVVYVTLGNEKDLTAYIVNYGTDQEIEAREKQILKAIAFRRYDKKRITLIKGGANPNGAGIWTKIYPIPTGVDVRDIF